jgi:hypothetical protein
MLSTGIFSTECSAQEIISTMIVQHQEKLSSVELVNSLRVLNYLSFKLFSRAALPPPSELTSSPSIEYPLRIAPPPAELTPSPSFRCPSQS